MNDGRMYNEKSELQKLVKLCESGSSKFRYIPLFRRLNPSEKKQLPKFKKDSRGLTVYRLSVAKYSILQEMLEFLKSV